MRLSEKRIIESLAEDVLSTYNISVPIQDMEDIVKILGGTIQRKMTDSGSAVVKNESGFQIIVSPVQEAKRERFIIAHELGHLFLHMGYMTNRDLWDKQENNKCHQTWDLEKVHQANEFAAAFLMPEAVYLAVLNENTNNAIANTAKIAEHFDVSVEAAASRGVALGYLMY